MSGISITDVPVTIVNAIKRASSATGADFEYLLKTAQQESNFNHKARSKSSSAAGLFQFIKSTWLKLVKEEGQKVGLGDYARHIEKSSQGSYHVRDKSMERRILDLRSHPELSATMAGIFTRQNSEYLQSQLGTTPSRGEVYAAHFLGPGNAVKLIKLAKSSPDEPAIPQFPSAARANPTIFKDGDRVRSVKQVYDFLTKTVADPIKYSKIQHRESSGSWGATVHKPASSLYPGASLEGQGIGTKTVSDKKQEMSEAGSIGIWKGMIEPRNRPDHSVPVNQKSLTAEQIDQKLAEAALKIKSLVPVGKTPAIVTTRSFMFLQGLVSGPTDKDE